MAREVSEVEIEVLSPRKGSATRLLEREVNRGER
jgi:hypothetical protein